MKPLLKTIVKKLKQSFGGFRRIRGGHSLLIFLALIRIGRLVGRLVRLEVMPRVRLVPLGVITVILGIAARIRISRISAGWVVALLRVLPLSGELGLGRFRLRRRFPRRSIHGRFHRLPRVGVFGCNGVGGVGS